MKKTAEASFGPRIRGLMEGGMLGEVEVEVKVEVEVEGGAD